MYSTTSKLKPDKALKRNGELRQWIIVAIGYIGIIYVMFSGARRLELRQNEVYGNDPEYQKYAKNTPILIPFLPIYTLAKYKWLQA